MAGRRQAWTDDDVRRVVDAAADDVTDVALALGMSPGVARFYRAPSSKRGRALRSLPAPPEEIAAPHVNSLRAGWTEERVEELRRRRVGGESASQIARAMGGITRNAVIGKCLRLGLLVPAQPSRPSVRTVAFHSPSPPRPAKRIAVAGATYAIPIGKPAPKPRPVLAIVAGEAVPILELRAHHCRAIVSPDGSPPTFCGLPKDLIGSYCPGHRALYYQAEKPGWAKRLDKSAARFA